MVLTGAVAPEPAAYRSQGRMSAVIELTVHPAAVDHRHTPTRDTPDPGN
jgi:hypothetical protein